MINLLNSDPRSNSSCFSKSTEAKQLVRQGVKQMLSLKQTRRPFLLIPSFFYALPAAPLGYVRTKEVTD